MEEQIRNYLKVLKSNPLDLPAFTALEELFKGADRWTDLVELYETRLRHLSDEREQITLRLRCAQVAAQWLPDSGRALGHYRAVLREDPDNRSALEGLLNLYQKSGDWSAVAQTLERLGSLTADSLERADIFEQLATVYLERLKQRERALVALRYARAADPKRRLVLERLFEVEFEQGAWKQALALAQEILRLGQTSPAEDGARFLKLGLALLEEPLEEAICRQALQQAQKLLPEAEEATKALQKLEQAVADREAHIKRLRVEAVESPDKGRAVSLYRQIAEIYFIMGGHEKNVEENLAKCNLLQPAHPRVLSFMERYFLQGKRYKELVDRLEEIIVRVKDPRAVVSLLERIAMYCTVYLQDPKAAVEVYRRILQLDAGHASATAALIEAYQEAGRWAEVVELARARAERQSDRTEKAAILLEVARINAEQLKDPQAARFQYEEVLRLEPENREAAEALVEQYEQAGEWAGLIKCLEALLQHTKDQKERLKLLDRIAAVRLERLNDPLEAFKAKERAFYLEPSRKKVVGELVELANRTGRYQDLVAALQAVVSGQRLKGKAQVALLEIIGEVCATRLNRPEEAVQAYQRIIEQDPKNLHALDALERLQTASGGSVELVDVYQRQLEIVRSAEKKKELLFKLASIFRDRMADFPRAVQTLEEVLKMDPQEVVAWRQLAELHERDGHWEEAARALEQTLRLNPSPAQAAEVRLHLAMIYEQRLNDSEQALTLCSQVLASGEAEAEVANGAVAVLERLQGRGVSALRIAEILQPYYALAGDWRRHVDMLELRLEACQAAEERLRLLESIAEVYEQRLSQKDLAFYAWGRALRLDPMRSDIRERVENLAQQVGRAADLAALYEEMLVEAPAEPWRNELLQVLARLYAEQLNRPRQAIRCLRELLQAEPDNRQALENLAGLFRQSSAWADFAATAGRLLQLEPDAARRRSLALELARVFESELHDRPSAIAVLEQLRQEWPEDLEILARLDALLEAAGRWSDLAQVLQQEIKLSKPQQAKELKLRLAAVRAERTEERQYAVEHYQQVLAENPGDARAIAGLEALLGQPEAAPAAARVLAPFYQQRRDWAGLVRTMQVMADCASEPSQRMELLVRLANVYEQNLEQPEKALTALRQAFASNEKAIELLPALERLAGRMGAYDLLAATLEDAVGAWSQTQAKVEVLQKLAALYRDALRRPDLCAAALRRLLELSPKNPQALGWLESIYRDAKSMADLAWVLEQQAALDEGAEKRRDRLLQVAQIREEQLGDLDGAIKIYRLLLDETPEDIQVAKQLERLYQATGRWREQAELLPLLARLSRNTLGVIEYQRNLARIVIERLDDPHRGVQILKQVLEVKPNHSETVADLEQLLRDERSRLAAAEVLEGVFKAAGEWRKLAAMIEMRLQKISDPGQRLQVYATLRQLYEEKIGEKALAFGAVARAFKEQPADAGVLQDLVRLAGESSLYEELAGLLMDVSEQHLGTELALSLRKKAAGILEQHLNRRAEAVKMWEQLSEAAPTDLEVLSSLERFYREEGRFDLLVKVYRAQLDLAENDEQRKDLLFRTAACLSEGLEDVEGAVLTYQNILELDADDRRALKLLDVLLESAGRWAELATVLERQITLLHQPASEQEAAELRLLLLRQSRLQLEQLKNPPAGLQALAEILRRFPDDAETVEMLEKLLADAALRLPVSEILEPVYLQRQDFRKLVAIMEIQLGAATDSAQRLRLYRQLLKLYEEQLGQKTMAFMVACRCFREFPTDRGIRQDLERLAQQTGSFEELAGVYEQVEASVKGSEVGAEIARRLAQLKEVHLQDKDDAVAHWRLVLASDPDDLEALRALERLYRERGAVGELVGILRHLGSMETVVERKKDLLHEVAGLLEERLGQPDGAIEVYREILSLDPQDLAVLKLLDRLLEREGRWEELHEVLEAELRLASGNEVTALQFRLAGLERLHLRKTESALGRYRQILAENPDNRDVVEALLKMFEAGEARSQVVEILPDSLERLGDWQHLIAVLEAAARSEDEPERAQRALVRMAEIYENRLGQKELAFTAWGRALLQNPAEEQVRLQLERLAAETQGWEMLAEVYRQGLEKVEAPSLQLVYHRRLAGLYAERLADRQMALEHLQQVVNLDAGDEAALRALESAYRQTNDYDRLIEILQRRVRLARQPQVQVQLLHEMAALYVEKLGDRGGAIQALRQLLSAKPDDLQALQQLEKLCLEQGRTKDLVEVLTAQLGVLEKSNDRAQLQRARFRLARLLDQEFQDGEKAAELLRLILTDDPRNAETIEYLEAVLKEGRQLPGLEDLLEKAYQATGDWKKYIDMLEAQVRSSRIMARRLELLAKIADIQEHRLGLKALAFNTTVRMFHEDLADPVIRQRLERLAEEDDNLEALAAVYEEELDNIEEPTVGAAIALKLADIYRQILKEEEQALRFLRVALRYQPRNLEALETLAHMLERRESAEEMNELVEVLGRQIELVHEPAKLAPLLYRMGEILYTRLSQPGKAVGYFRKVLEVAPGNVAALKMLEKIFQELGEHESLYEIMRARLELSGDKQERMELVTRLSQLASGPLGRPDEAIALWQEMMAAGLASEQGWMALDQLYEKTERWTELAALIEQRMGRTSDPEKLATLSARLGWVKSEKLGQLEEAKKSFLEVLRLDPKDVGALRALREIYRSGGEWEELVKVLRRLVQLQEDMIGVKQVRFELAEVLGDKLNRRAEAIEAAKRAADIEPHSAADLDRLARIFQANEAWPDAVAVLEQSVELKDNDADKIECLLQVAALWRDRIQRPLGAATVFEKILDIDPLHEDAFRSAEIIYRENKEWRRLTALLERRLSGIREKRDRLTLVKEIAAIYEERLAQKELAFARYCAAFREDFSDDEVLAKLERLADETQDYDTLLAVLDDATEEVSAGPRAVGLLRKMANIYKRLGNLEQAEVHLRRAADLDPREVEALESLAALLEEGKRWEQLVSVLEITYERCDELQQRKDVRSRIARLQEEKLGRPDLAVESYRRILELDGREETAIQSLIRLYQQQQRWSDLIQVLRRAAEQASERTITIGYLSQIAAIWETELGDDEQAIQAYQHLLEVEPTHLESLLALERIYTRLDRWHELLGVFEREVALVREAEEQIKIYNKMASIWEERFANLSKAISCHESILAIHPQNLNSLKALERLVRHQGDFNRLIELYEKHLELADPAEKVEIHLALGDVWYRELSRVDKAEEVFARALKIEPKSRPAIHALGQLYEKSGNWFNAIDMLQREAELCGATPEAVDLYYRMGKINEDMLLDSQAARQAYGRAMEIDPSYLPAIKALKLIYYLEKDYDQYLQMMVQEAEHTEDSEEKTRLYYEIGKFLQEHYDDSTRAAQYYEEALRRTADYLPAAKPLADIYFRSEQWERAESIMEVVVQGLDRNTEARELCRQHYRMGYITEKLNKFDKSLEHYRQSYELDPTYLPALEGLGNALIKAEKWEEAYRIYQTILIHHRDGLSDAEVAELYWQIGDINFQMKESERAIAAFKKALEIDDTHLASLQYLSRIYEERGSWEDAYDVGMKMVDALGEDELYEHLLRLGDLCRDKLQDAFRAVDAYQGALRYRPDSLELLVRLLEVYRNTRQFQKAVESLEAIVKVESRPSKLVEYHEQAGDLLLGELHDDLKAVEHYNAALDIDPSRVRAFTKIVEILRRRKDWPSLKENYIRMIKRLPVEARKVKLTLWKDLGELCRVVLRNLAEAQDAYRMITALDPENVENLAILADLLGAKQATVSEAIATHHKVLSMAANRVDSYRALWKLYNSRKEYDKVFVMASILRYLKKADEEERKIVNFFSHKAPEVASRPVNDSLWETALAHPGVKVPFTRLFSVLYTKAPAMFIKEHKTLNLRKGAALDLARDRSLFAHNFRIASKVLGGMNVELYAQKEEAAPHPPGIVIVPTMPTAMIAYQEAFREDRKKHLLFQIGRQLAAARPQFILACIMGLKQLDELLQAACSLCSSSFQVTADAHTVEAVRSRLKRALSETGRGMLEHAVREYLPQAKGLNLKSWVEAVEHSINRAGFVVCNDLSTVMGILSNEGAWMTPMRPIQKVREMLVFASSPEYLSLREKLGLAVSA